MNGVRPYMGMRARGFKRLGSEPAEWHCVGLSQASLGSMYNERISECSVNRKSAIFTPPYLSKYSGRNEKLIGCGREAAPQAQI